MKSINMFTVFILLTSFFASGQPSSTTLPKIKVIDFYLQNGIFTTGSMIATLEDFEKLAPHSTLLKKDFSGFSSTNKKSLDQNSCFGVMIGLHFLNKEKTIYRSNPVLKLGVSFFSGSSFYFKLNKEDRRPFDTLTSSITNDAIYIDSVTNYSYKMKYSSEQIRLDGALVFSTNPDARWSLYSGVGVTVGISINTNTDIIYSIDRRTESSNATYNIYEFRHRKNNDQDKEETFRNKTNVAFSAYIPLGIDFRIGKKREFWKRLHLFYEMRPGINITTIPELGTFSSSLIQHSLGLKVTF